MPALAASAEKPASAAELAFERVGGRTAVVRCRARTPLKLLTPRHAGAAGWACMSSHGGGLLNGDSVALRVEVRAGASAALVTQASTKIYPGRPGSRQTVDATVAAGGLLVVAPDPVVCFAGSRYAQRQAFDLAPTANLAVVDWLTSGRAANGERWAFESYESRLVVRRGGKELLRDATLLDEEAGRLPGRLGRFDVIALALATGPRLAAGARRLLEETARLSATRRAPRLVSASPVGKDGALLRVAAESFEDASTELRRALTFVWDALGDDPWSSRA
jgi:urease accessory protein